MVEVLGKIDSVFAAAERFSARTGIPMLIGEWGTTEATPHEVRVAVARHVMTRSKETGIPCFYWENERWGEPTDEFSLYDRRNGKWVHKDLLELCMEIIYLD